MKYHNKSAQEVLRLLESDCCNGLRADQVTTRQNAFGENKLKAKKKKTNFQRFLNQFKDVMILILLAAAAVSFVIACVDGNPKEFFEPVLILLIVVLNSIMGVMQESKAEKALDALQSLSAPHARVIREGTESVINAAQLVPGDIIRLEAGDFVPADARLIHSAGLKSEESALTGESVPSDKDADVIAAEDASIGDRTNMVFSGCSITYGTALAIVTATGMDTEMGKIADLLDHETESQTPLQKRLANLGRNLGVIALAACVIVFFAGVINGIPTLEIFMTAVSLAVSAIPEGLPAIVTIVLSIGVQRMVKKNALIRRLPAVETLGSASVICSDKTGTLTQNRMTLVKVYMQVPAILSRAYVSDHVHAENLTTCKAGRYDELLKYAALCCDGIVEFEGEEEKHIGDPTETAIVLAAHKRGMPKAELNVKYPRLAEIPFDSDRKLMTTVNQINGRNIVIVKGAFDVICNRCIHGGLDIAKRITAEMSSDALRVLAVAYKEIDHVPEHPTSEEMENGLTFMGLLGMIDPPRPEAKEAVSVCRRAGIKPVMITGDHIITAAAIAKELGIMKDGDRAITGAELDAMSDDQLHRNVQDISVYARVSPENKIRIVKAWQQNGHIVSMTGDGVNDAPALKAADIGCAMGITGTDVAKGAADMTLTDDNFATIVDAVREGRGIYDNIRKVVGFLLGTNIGEVIAVFSAMILWHKTPFLSMQLLWINLVTDSLPAIALGMEAVESDVMDKKPRPKNEGIFAGSLGIRIVLQGVMFAVLALIGFRLGENVTGTLAGGQTMAFMILALSQTIHVFNMRSERSLFRIGFFSNHKLNWAVLISVLLMALVLFTPVSIAFGLVKLPAHLYLIALGLIFVPLAATEIFKAIKILLKKK